jgi:hypothetical protein
MVRDSLVPDSANRGRGRGRVPDSGQIGDGDGGASPPPGKSGDGRPVPVPGQIGDGDGGGDRGVRALRSSLPQIRASRPAEWLVLPTWNAPANAAGGAAAGSGPRGSQGSGEPQTPPLPGPPYLPAHLLSMPRAAWAACGD